MASSMAPNERRWTSTRKPGMTVLGKVPKPINLPSQKLENDGLDPNVEIVPKGTLTWGARPPLAASNTWGTSTLSSPRADGSVNSPNFANGRPTSGGSGTRPSTSSSERSNEPAASSWGPSSRPSSASGILPTCHISAVANRPRSAEIRSSSSQLSRFAESSSDNTAGGAAGTSGKIAADTSKRCDFTLTSGDFPTLGSEKSCEPKSQQGNGNPGQALHGTFNSWSADSDPHAGKGASTRSDNWHRDYHNALPQLNANMPPQQFVSWHGHPVHPPNGVWYGGHEAGGPYRLPGPLQSYHVAMYSPYPTAGGIANAEAFPRLEANPGRVQLKNGEACSYMPPESYVVHSQSVIPVRPGIYSGPILYEGCYGPPCTSSDNFSDQDASKGMPRQYGVHNLHPSEKLKQKHQRFHAQADRFDAVRTKEQMVPAHANDTQGHYNVLLKQHDSRKHKEALEEGNQLGFSAPEAGLLNNSNKQEQTTDRQHDEVDHSQHAGDLVDPNIGNSLETPKVAGDDVTMKLVTATEQVSDIQHNPIIKKNVSLMEKVEGLNSEARVAEVHFEGKILPTKEKMKNDCRSIINTQHLQMKAGLSNVSSANNSISGSSNAVDCQFNSFTKDITHQSVINLRFAYGQSVEQIYVPGKSSYSEVGGQSQAHNQKRVHDIKAKVDRHHEKLKFGSYVDDEMNSIMQRHSLEDINMAAGKSVHELSVPGLCASVVTPSDQSSRIILKSDSYPSTLESIDHDIQHKKLKEMARQRAIQLQKEEEQRTMEQKAKALAKLNELNQRTSESSKHNLSHPIPLCNDTINEHDTASCKDAEADSIEAPCNSFSCDFEVQKQANDDNNVKKLADPADFLYNQSSRASQSSFQVSGTPSEQSLSLSRRSTSVIVTGRAASDSHDSNVSRRKQAGYRRRRNVLDERSQPEKLTNFENSGNTKCVSMAPEDLTNSLDILNNEDHIQARNRNNSGPKYKNELTDSQPNCPLPVSPHPVGTSGKFDLESDETKSLATGVEGMRVSEKISDETAVGLGSIGLRVPPDQAGSETSKSTFVRASNNWKPHLHRKPGRNLQSDKTNAKYQGSETVVWAPVKLVCKNESSVEVDKSSASGITDLPDGKICLNIHSNAKARRAEMERYVPKPIAKELSLHGGSQLFFPLSTPVSSADVSRELDLASASAMTGRYCSSVAKTALASENRNVENTKQSRHGKPLASWRQRNSGESESHEQSAVEGGLSSATPKCVEKSELQPSVPSDDWHVGGGNGMRNEPTVIKNTSFSRQRRQQFKARRVDRSSYSPSQSNVLLGEEPDKSKIESQVPDDSSESNSSRYENQNAGSDHMRSHWKPKSFIHPQQPSHDYKGSGGQRAADKLLPSQATAKNFDDSDALGQVNNMIEVNDRKILEGKWEGKVMTNAAKYQEGTRERKVVTKPSKYHNQSLDEDMFIHTESGAANADSHHEHLGVRGHGQYHGRFSRVRNSAHGGSQRGQSSGQVRDDGQNFEYQNPVNYDELGEFWG